MVYPSWRDSSQDMSVRSREERSVHKMAAASAWNVHNYECALTR